MATSILLDDLRERLYAVAATAAGGGLTEATTFTPPNSLAWAHWAACQGYDLDLFFSDAEQKVQEAKQICGRCPVRAECLDESMRAEDASRYGIYGGLTPDERAKLAGRPVPQRGGRARVDSGHGDYRTYAKGCRCRDCREAKTAYTAVWRDTRFGDAAGADQAGHGKQSTYRNYGCRCQLCKAANTAAQRQWRARRRGQAVAGAAGGGR
ncbi:WhiB family transcriptional regulator [Streptomyces mexicanus]|uniref:WhiB family transcriptional regulator n=1 Tax=Streptomyces mexicanus TaxID=178566 RepID=UPI0036505C63